MDFNSAVDWDEAFEYLPGLTVELKSCPGTLDTISGYDLTMVPPIWLENDPCPRYPHELRVISEADVRACHLSREAINRPIDSDAYAAKVLAIG